ncbi:N-acyl-L-amino acid amidohydrolase [Longibacter salinarum]|uniref:N-acyl-L-amino acid amidohydrolase n=1 Tax=Longibacter salinarum TaxID=1850348 RepID=A0A2A8D225_9BACT|nr:amidohydrolase [Longibacter salinarum]PEN14940.1 N-acyl-L-amino acid amidohydrolase [Longibacter salinarum]
MSSRVSPVDAAHLPDNVADVVGDDVTLARLLIAIRRHLHMNPEIGMQEHSTSQFIRTTLEGYGLDVTGPVAGTGLFVDIEGTKEPVNGEPHKIGYRADIDALPAADQKHCPYRSQNPGVAHLCGHDAHTAVGIGVALVLNQMRDEIPGTVRVFFQPNEEGLPSGAPLMIRSGVLDGLEAVYGIHVDPTLDVGRYGLLTGPVTAASDRFDVYVRQEGTGHSARPHEGADTIWIANQIMNQFYQLAGRVTDARNAAVLTVCKMQGSDAHNVIPETAQFGGTLRSINQADRETIRQHMRRTAEEFGKMYDANVELAFEDGAPPVVNDGRAVSNIARSIKSMFGEQAIYNIPQSSMGGEDFAYYLQELPGAFIRVGTSSSPKTSFPLHHHQFDIDERPLAPTARLMSRVLVNHLGNEKLMEDATPFQRDGYDLDGVPLPETQPRSAQQPAYSSNGAS